MRKYAVMTETPWQIFKRQLQTLDRAQLEIWLGKNPKHGWRKYIERELRARADALHKHAASILPPPLVQVPSGHDTEGQVIFGFAVDQFSLF